MRIVLALLCAVTIAVPTVLAQPAPAAPGPVAGDTDLFAGTWSGSGMSLTLRKTGERYTGMATAAGRQYPLQAQISNGVMTGIYSDDRALKVFQAFVEGDVMQLAADGGRLVLQRQGAMMAASSNTDSESYSSGPNGSVAGQTRGGGQGRWRVQQGMLAVPEDGAPWQPLPMQISQNSNGYPVVNVDGKEFSSCR